MKVFWKSTGQLQMEAESAAELEVIDALMHGPYALSQGPGRVLVRERELPFAREGKGMVSLIGEAMVVTGIVLDLERAARQRQALQATQTLGQALGQLVSLLPAEVKGNLSQAAARVAPVQGDLEKQLPV
jgi:hypothetical protein